MPDRLQHIRAIAQRNSAEQGEVTEDERLALDRATHGQVFEHLGDGIDSVLGSVDQYIEGGLGVDEQCRHVVAVAGERLEAVFGVGGWFCVGMIGSRFCHFLKLKSRNVNCQQPSSTVLLTQVKYRKTNDSAGA